MGNQSTQTQTKFWNIFLLLILHVQICLGASCGTDQDCGIHSVCYQSECKCETGFDPGYKNSCVNKTCNDDKCVECNEDKLCRRCVDFIMRDTSKCVDTCSSESVYSLKGEQLGYICPASSQSSSEHLSVYVIVVVAASVCLFIVLALGFLFYWRLKKSEGERTGTFKIPEENGGFTIPNQNGGLRVRRENGHASGFGESSDFPTSRKSYDNLTYDNAAFENDAGENLEIRIPSEEDKKNFHRRLHALRPYADIFLQMLNEIKTKFKTLDPEDVRVPVYKNVIHQLCRVLTLLNKKEGTLVMPSDGNDLLNWADHTVQQYQEMRETTNNNSPESVPPPDLRTTAGLESSVDDIESDNKPAAELNSSRNSGLSENGFTTFGYSDKDLDRISDISADRSSMDSDYLNMSGNLTFPLEEATEPIEV